MYTTDYLDDWTVATYKKEYKYSEEGREFDREESERVIWKSLPMDEL